MRAIAMGVEQVAEQAQIKLVILDDQNGLSHDVEAFPACVRGRFRRIGGATQLLRREGFSA
jgi:hypothetical protein